MGLDISYYRQLKVVENASLDEYGHPVEDDLHVRFGPSMEWSESVWPGRGHPHNAIDVYSFADSYCFHAGSYSGYGSWRRQLATVAGRTSDFIELIDFADNEGVIGSTVSAKLAADFKKHLARVEAMGEQIFLESYRNWMKAFEVAADGGAVQFH